ncbi:MAG: dihydrodipicolinate reductase [Thermodesulfobacteriota bacterium]|nr:dihydrodipicolinate reductase [Thermodesulfobacteriota bacterium]
MTPIKLMLNGLPGNVAMIIAGHAAKDEQFELLPWSLTGPEIEQNEVLVEGTPVALVRPDARNTVIQTIMEANDRFISVDYTHPGAVNDNVRFYCDNHLPFVMGTTGGDREALVDTVAASHISAVIAPNMAKQIVGFQAMIAYAAENFPGLFTGYEMTVRESHQQGKADTSGTAKAVVRHFNQLGVDITEADIIKERNPAIQKTELGIPEEHLVGHAWHTYTLLSPDRSAKFEFTHNINGRDIYADGTLDAVRYLLDKINQGVTGKVFSMIDVLRQA